MLNFANVFIKHNVEFMQNRLSSRRRCLHSFRRLYKELRIIGTKVTELTH